MINKRGLYQCIKIPETIVGIVPWEGTIVNNSPEKDLIVIRNLDILSLNNLVSH